MLMFVIWDSSSISNSRISFRRFNVVFNFFVHVNDFHIIFGVRRKLCQINILIILNGFIACNSNGHSWLFSIPIRAQHLLSEIVTKSKAIKINVLLHNVMPIVDNQHMHSAHTFRTPLLFYGVYIGGCNCQFMTL